MLSEQQIVLGQRVVRELSLGQLVEIGLDTDEGVLWCPVRLEDYDRSGEQLRVTWPRDETGRVRSLYEGQKLTFEAAWPDDALYSVDMHVEMLCPGTQPGLVLRAVGQWTRLQRRLAFRLPVVIRPTLSERLADDGWRPIEAGISNLSAGGCRVRSRHTLHIGDRLDFAFCLPGPAEPELRLRVNVRHVEKLEKGDAIVWEAGCEFHEPRTAHSERIVQFIFKQQRLQARRESRRDER